MCVVLQCLLVSCVRTQAACGCRCCVYMCELVVIKLSQGAQVKPLPWTVGTGNYEKWIISNYQLVLDVIRIEIQQMLELVNLS